MMKQAKFFAIPAAVLLTGGILCAAPAPQQPLAQVLVAKAGEAAEVDSRRYSGLVVSPAVVQLVPRVSGELLEIGFHDGDVVKKGQMLYKFNPIRYEAAVKSAEAKIAECKARLEYAQSVIRDLLAGRISEIPELEVPVLEEGYVDWLGLDNHMKV